MYAVVEIAGKQYTVSPKDTIEVPTLAGKVGDTVTFERVLLLGDDAKATVGAPHVAAARVQAKILGGGRDPKVVVFKKKRRKGYRVLRGHRQPFTTIEITGIAQ
jgi:large subunit ribosomal protein L21